MAREEDTLGEFVHELTLHQDDLFFFIRALCGNSESAADIRQAVNVVLWKKRSHFKLGTSFKNWSFRVAELEVKVFLRKRRRDGLLLFEPDIMETFLRELPEFSDQLPERRSALSECLKGLTPKDAELLRHRYWQSGSLEQLALATNRSVGTLKARLFQLRARLRLCISKRLEDPA
jgi:RNA polymerase sigma-70 factor, ECF subfamily